MSILSGVVSTIRSAIYGKEMRESIAKGFELVDGKLSEAGGMGGGFVLMEEDIPIAERKENVLYAKIVANLNDEAP